MLHTFTKRGLRGFTLIELLVVIAIIGLLSTVIAGPVQTARKKGRDAKKIADIEAIQNALSQYSEDNSGTYPISIDGLVPKYLQVLPPNAATTTVAKDKYMYVTYKDAAGNIVGYHLGVALEMNTTALQQDADCYGTGCNAATGQVQNSNYAASGAGAGTAGNGIANANTAAANAATNVASDFDGRGTAEPTAAGVCTTALTTCIYDVVPEN